MKAYYFFLFLFFYFIFFFFGGGGILQVTNASVQNCHIFSFMIAGLIYDHRGTEFWLTSDGLSETNYEFNSYLCHGHV